MIDHNHFICHFIFGGHLLNIPTYKKIFHRRALPQWKIFYILSPKRKFASYFRSAFRRSAIAFANSFACA